MRPSTYIKSMTYLWLSINTSSHLLGFLIDRRYNSRNTTPTGIPQVKAFTPEQMEYRQKYQRATYRTVNVRVESFAELTALSQELNKPFTKLIKDMIIAYREKLAREANGK